MDIYPNGRSGKRIRKKFDTKLEALHFEKYVLNKSYQDKDWNASKKDNRTILELIDYWFQIKGIHLKDGEKRKRCLTAINVYLDNPIAVELKPRDFLNYISTRKSQGISDKTLNNHLGYMNALFNSLNNVDEISYENPLRKVEMIKLDERELSWLSVKQIEMLFQTITNYCKNPHVLLITKLCLATGARWSEIENLKLHQVNNNKITLTRTKNRRIRSIPIAEELCIAVCEHLRIWKSFTSLIGAFRRALKITEIKLPKGQAAHVLRHSFASHFMINGGNILTLQKILGHASINMTMRYAHLSPDHLMDAVKFNPMAGVSNLLRRDE